MQTFLPCFKSRSNYSIIQKILLIAQPDKGFLLSWKAFVTTLFNLAFTQNQVKEITDDCQTVKWESCVLEPTEVPFDVPKVTCKPDDYYKTLKRVEVEQPIELNQMKCKVLETTACKPVEREVVREHPNSKNRAF